MQRRVRPQLSLCFFLLCSCLLPSTTLLVFLSYPAHSFTHSLIHSFSHTISTHSSLAYFLEQAQPQLPSQKMSDSAVLTQILATLADLQASQHLLSQKVFFCTYCQTCRNSFWCHHPFADHYSCMRSFAPCSKQVDKIQTESDHHFHGVKLHIHDNHYSGK